MESNLRRVGSKHPRDMPDFSHALKKPDLGYYLLNLNEPKLDFRSRARPDTITKISGKCCA